MRLFASFLTLIPALLLIGLAYHGYADSASIQTLTGGDFDHFASRASDGFSIQEAERQSGLVIAGMEAGRGFSLASAERAFCSAIFPAHPRGGCAGLYPTGSTGCRK
jgi:hypothetical protein